MEKKLNRWVLCLLLTMLVMGGVTSSAVAEDSPLIKGSVLTPDGTIFIPGMDSYVDVCIRYPDGGDAGWTNIDNNGSYQFGAGIPAGDYKLYAYAGGNNNPFANSAAVQVHVVAGALVTQDISLTNPVITGRVLTPDGTPYTGRQDSWVPVYLEEQNSNNQFAGTSANDDGSFKIGGAIPNGDYFLHADARGSNNPYTDAAPLLVHIMTGTAVTQDISLTNPVITGKVLKPDGSAFTPGLDSGAGIELKTAGSDEWHIASSDVYSDGSFRLGGNIPAGDYKLYAYAGGNNNPFANSAAVQLHVVAGALVTQDISLTNPVITGRVLTPDGTPYTGRQDSWVPVYLEEQNSNNQFAGTSANDDGSFKIGGAIPNGDYFLHADARGSNNPYTDAAPLLVHIMTGTAVTQDISLTNPVITGKVLKPDGSAFTPGLDSGAGIELKTAGSDEWHIASSDVYSDGSFRLGGNIPAGDYKLYAHAGGNNNPFANSEAVQVHVVAGELITQDIRLSNRVATLYFDPTTQSLAVGCTAKISLRVKDAVDLYGADIQLSFNPSIIQVVYDGLSIGDAISGLTVQSQTYYDNTNGFIQVVSSRQGDNNSFNGDGELLKVTFRAINPGTCNIGFGDITLSDSEAQAINFTTQVGAVNVISRNSVSGYVYLQGVSGYAGGVTVKLIDSSCNIIATTTSDASGCYLLDKDIYANPIPAGNYFVTFSKPVYLTEASDSFYLSGDYKVPNIKLSTGDINCDNHVDFGDLLVLASLYGQSFNCNDQDNWLPYADLNRDNRISIFDLVLMARNYGMSGYGN